MAISNRQQQLFAAEDWTVAYKAYANIDFQAYDFDTVRAALVDYVRANFPENYNDYIESSEFIAIIELLAYLSQSLAFRMDVNTRENFLETAERRDSVFKLARMLGYAPKRNQCAQGLLKITSLKTTEPLRDSRGALLANKTIYWDDANNPQSYDQFITILNAAMSSTNRFTSPVKSGQVNNVMTELYQINTAIGAPIAYGVTVTVNGTKKPFSIINPDFTDNADFFERHPDPNNAFNLIYRNDGKGLSSSDTGFFVMFKQGTLSFSDFNYTVPIQSRTQDLNVANINETDVYLQEISLLGEVLNKWEKISNATGQTINFNSILKNTKNLYAVETVGNTGIKIKFPDGNFGNVPVGIYRVWYRVSDPTEYSILPEDARNVSFTISYRGNDSREYFLTVSAALQSKVENSRPAETLTEIKTNAPDVYYTQNRMVSAQDYNVFPLAQSTNIKKMKAINRTHAGHSRYIDINDPTGSYHNVDVYAKDAYLYVEKRNISELITVNPNTTPLDVVTSTIPNYLKAQRLNNFVYHDMRNIYIESDINKFRLDILGGISPTNITWNPLPINTSGKTGFIKHVLGGTEYVLVNNVENFRVFKENNFIKWVNPTNSEDYKWTRIISVENNGLLSSGYTTGVGPWTLSEEITQGWIATEVIVSLRKLFNLSEANAIVDEIENRRTFALKYDAINDVWEVIVSANVDRDNEFAVSADPVTGADSGWLLLFDYTPVANDLNSYRYNVTVRGEEYVIQSKNDLRFYNVKAVKVLDSDNKSSKDLITYPTINNKPSTQEVYEWQVNGSDRYWRNINIVNSYYKPSSYSTGIPLKTRNTRWYEVVVSWRSNFGLIPNGDLTNATASLFVPSEAIMPLNTYFQTTGTSGNVIINNNSGQITKFPSSITIPFSGTSPFGANILDVNGNITYRQYSTNGDLEYFHGAANVYSYGVAGNTLDITSQGRLRLLDADVTTQSGNLIYTGLEGDKFFRSTDVAGTTYADKILVDYLVEKEALDLPIDWSINDVYRYADGYVDPRKVAVAPLDTDNDLVPDRPLQFREYVGSDDLVFFENYTDFDGYTYDRPIEGVILDYRFESEFVYDASAKTISPATHSDPVKVSTVDWILVNNTLLSYFQEQILVNDFLGIVIYNVDTETPYMVSRNSTDGIVTIVETADYFVRPGRGQTQNTGKAVEDSVIRWRHSAPNDVRIDPSISNVIEMVMLTNEYYNDVVRYQAYPRGDFPAEPTSAELSVEFSGLNEFKNASDSIVYRSAKFKRLFGTGADAEYRAKFRVVKLNNQYSDNELKTRVLKAINEYFDVDNWEFGETFYFTELSTYIHQQLGSAIGSIVIVPKNTSGTFGQLFQVKAEPNELFLNTATVNDIELISKIDSQTLRSDR